MYVTPSGLVVENSAGATVGATPHPCDHHPFRVVGGNANRRIDPDSIADGRRAEIRSGNLADPERVGSLTVGTHVPTTHNPDSRT
jgi:hypothetical protein